jgi:hypothetical protein
MIKKFAAFFIFICLVNCNSKKAPILNVDTSQLEKINDTTTRSSFIIKNDGNKTLVIEDFISSCTCSVLDLKKGDSILPNKFISIPITFERDSPYVKKIVLITIKANTIPQLKTIKVVI